jgi:hypothetical protein
MPPPKQKPVAATFLPRTRRRSSDTAAFMSASKRAGSICERAAATCASSPTFAVPPSSGSKSRARAVRPSAANRPATWRMWSVRPRFSWMTRTEPRGRRAAAYAPWSVPRGPRNVIGCVAMGAQFSTPDACAARPMAAAVVAAAFDALVVLEPQAASSPDAVVAPKPSNPRRRMASRRVMMPSA